jgi:capsular polysaccharide biosynthesis protein/cellulose biosynthesis protein BcsQ
VTIEFIIAALKRFRIIVALLTVATFAAAAAYGMTKPPWYEASADLTVSRPVIDDRFNSNEEYSRDQAALITSSVLVNRVAKELNITDVVALSAAVSAEVTPPSKVTITAADTSAAMARDIANQFANSYLALQEERSAAVTKQRSDSLKSRIKLLETQINTINNSMPNATPNAQAIYSAQLQSAQATQQDLQNQLNDLEVSTTGLTTSEVISPARLPKSQSGLPAPALMAAGFVGGLALGTFVAIVLAGGSRRVLDATQLQHILRTQVVADVPNSPEIAAVRYSNTLIPTETAAPLDRLAARVLSHATDRTRSTRLVGIGGTERYAGSTTLTLAIAQRLALGGSSVLIVDLDPRGALAKNARAKGEAATKPATRTRDAKASTPEDGSQITETVQIDTLISVATLAGDTAERHRLQLTALIAELGEIDYDVVLMDLGCLPDSSVAVRVAQSVDSIVVAIPIERTRVATIRTLPSLLQDQWDLVLPVVTHTNKGDNQPEADRSERTTAAVKKDSPTDRRSTPRATERNSSSAASKSATPEKSEKSEKSGSPTASSGAAATGGERQTKRSTDSAH